MRKFVGARIHSARPRAQGTRNRAVSPNGDPAAAAVSADSTHVTPHPPTRSLAESRETRMVTVPPSRARPIRAGASPARSPRDSDARHQVDAGSGLPAGRWPSVIEAGWPSVPVSEATSSRLIASRALYRHHSGTSSGSGRSPTRRAAARLPSACPAMPPFRADAIAGRRPTVPPRRALVSATRAE